MYIRRKLYSYVEGEYVPVNETKLFAAKDDAKGAAVGAGIAAGTAGVGAAGLYGAKKVTDKAVSNAVKNRMAILTGEIAGDAAKADARHEAAQTASNRVNKIIKSTKGWLTNAEGKEAAKAYEKTIAGKSGAAKKAMVEKLARLEKAAGRTALKRQIGVGAAILGTGAAAGAGVKHLADKRAEKQYSVLMTEEEYRMFSEMIEAQKEFGDNIDGQNIRIGSKARIWADKHLQTKKDREAMIEAYDQEGPRNSHKLGKQAAKWATGGAAIGLAGASVADAVSNPEEAKEVANRVGRVLKVATKNKKVAKAVAKDAAKIGGGIGALGAGIASGAYLGTRGGRLIGKGVENISESAAHNAQKTADENKVASGKMSKEDFAKKYGKNVRLDSNK